MLGSNNETGFAYKNYRGLNLAEKSRKCCSPAQKAGLFVCPRVSGMATKKKKHIVRGFEIPWNEVERIFTEGRERHFDAWRKILVLCGPSFMEMPGGISKRTARDLVKMNWVRRDGKTGRYYQRKLDEIFDFRQGGDKAFHEASWLQFPADCVLYTMLVSDYTKAHKAAAPPMQKSTPEQAGPLNHRRMHNGGMSHSEVKRRTGMSVGRSSMLRRKCAIAGICSFTERYDPTDYDSAFHGKVVCEDDRHLFDGKYRPWARLTSKYNPGITVEWRTHWRRGRTEGCENRNGGMGQLENYCTGKTLARYG